MLEIFLIRSQQFPKWFKNLTFNDNSIKELYESCYIFPLKERDEDGCRVIMIQTNKINTQLYTFDDIVRILNFVIFVLSEED